MTVKMTAVSANEKVYRRGDAPALETPVYLFPGSYACFQVNIVANEYYQDGAYLRVVGGPAARAVSMRRVGLIPAVEDCKYGHDDYYDLREDHLYPDVLEPFNPKYIHAAPNNNQTFFFRVDDNDKIPYGEQFITVRFYAAKKFVKSVKVKLIKMPEALPEQKCIYTNWMHYDSYVTQHHVRLFSRDFYKLFKSYLDAAKIGGQNMILVPLFTPAFDTEIGYERPTAQLLDISEPEAGKFVFDFKKTNEFIKFVLANGMKYLEMAPFFSQWGAKFAPKIMVRNAKGRIARRFGWETDALSDDYKNFLDQLLVALNANLRENGWEEISFFHISDEPHADQAEQYLSCKAFIKARIGKSRLLDACSDLVFAGKDATEYSVCVLNALDKYIEANVRPLCTYNCCGPHSGYYSNRFLSMPLARMGLLGLQLYRYDIDLFLHWGFNFYNSVHSRRFINPYNNTDSDGAFTAGDAFIVYPDYAGFGANPSLRLYAMGEAFRLARMLYLYESKAGREAALAFLDEEGVTGLNVYPKETGWIDRLTDRLAQKILGE